jgi:hypothetical protein
MHETHGCAGGPHELSYTTMQTTRLAALISCAVSLSVGGCGGTDQRAAGQGAAGQGAAGAPSGISPSRQSVTVVQVGTITTVQSSLGTFLSPTPEQLVPTFVESAAQTVIAAAAEQQERAKIDLALLFRGTEVGSFSQQLNAQLVSANAATWSAIEQSFPHVDQSAAFVRWPLIVSSVAVADLDSTVSPEWRGWQDFRGLAVRGKSQLAGPSVPVATLGFETTGFSSPLVLRVESDSLTVTNRSAYAIPRALLIYSHPGGVGVTALQLLNPGERRVTVLGPKEHPPDELLDLAREQLTDFFAASVGRELASAMSAAKSIPFLETQGLRLVALLGEEQEAVAVSFSTEVSAQQRVVLSHSEILKPEEELRVLGMMLDPSVELDQARVSLGRFTQAKLEFAAHSEDASASERALVLLRELRNQ